MISSIVGEWFINDTEAAFANWRMWQCLGVSVIFFCQDYLDLNTKLVIVSSSWCVGFCGLLIVRIRSRRKSVVDTTKKSSDFYTDRTVQLAI